METSKREKDVSALPDPLEEFHGAIDRHASGPVPRNKGADADCFRTLRSIYHREAGAVLDDYGDLTLDEAEADTEASPEEDWIGGNFPREVQHDIHWLILLARNYLQTKDRLTFYQEYRCCREHEHQLPPEQKSFLFAHLSVLLSGRTFSVGGERKTVVFCREEDLDCDAPFLYARDTAPSLLQTGMSTAVSLQDAGERVQLIDVLAGIDLKE